MAHNLAQRIDGTYMALYAERPAWHNLGKVVPGNFTAKRIARDVFGNRVVESVPAFAKLGRKIVEVPEYRAIADVKAGTVFAFATPTYLPVQDLEPLMLAEAVTQTRRRAVFESAGALNANASRGFASIDLTRALPKDALAIKGDPSGQEAHLFVTWAHDGTGAVTIGRYRNRVECQNLLNAATASAGRAGKLVRIVHAGGAENMAARMREAEEILGFVERDFAADTALMNALNAIAIPKLAHWLDGFVELLVPIPQEMDRPVARTEAREAIKGLILASKTLVGVKDTAYRVYQGVAEYADHYRNLRIASGASDTAVAQRRFASITEGPAADLKQQALDILRKTVEGQLDEILNGAAKVPVPVGRAIGAQRN